MAGSPRFKVYRNGEYVASTRYAEDAAMLVAGCETGQIKDGVGGRMVYSVTKDGDTGNSYDEAAKLIWQHIQEQYAERKARYDAMTTEKPRARETVQA